MGGGHTMGVGNIGRGEGAQGGAYNGEMEAYKGNKWERGIQWGQTRSGVKKGK